MPPKNSILLTAGGMTVNGSLFRKQLLRLGRWVSPADEHEFLEVTKPMLDTMVENFKSRVYGDVPVLMDPKEDNVHHSGPEFTKGFVRGLSVQTDGLYADIELVDPAARELAAKNLIPGVSIELISNYKDHEHGNKEVGPVLGHVAVCNAPYMKNMRGWEPVPAVQCGEDKVKVLYFSEDKPMTLAELLKKLMDEHKIDVPALQTEAAKVPTLTVELTDYKKAHPAVVVPPTEIQKDPAFVSLTERVTAAETSNKDLLKQANAAEAEVKRLKDEAINKTAIEAVDLLLSEGKIKPTAKAQWLTMAKDQPALFAEVSKTLEVVVDLKELGTSQDGHRPITKTLTSDAVKGEVKNIAEGFGLIKKQKTA